MGVAGSTQNRGLDWPRQPEIFASVRPLEGWSNQLFLLIRTRVEPRNVLPAVRREVAAMDRDQPIYAIQTLKEAFAASMAQRRIASGMLSSFAVFALLLAAGGIFSIVSYKVMARTREIGIRIALGATAPQVRRLVLRQALFPVAAGAGAGLLAGLGLGSLMEESPVPGPRDGFCNRGGRDLVTCLSSVGGRLLSGVQSKPAGPARIAASRVNRCLCELAQSNRRHCATLPHPSAIMLLDWVD